MMKSPVKSGAVYFCLTTALVAAGALSINHWFPKNDPKKEMDALSFFLGNRKGSSDLTEDRVRMIVKEELTPVNNQLSEINKILASRLPAVTSIPKTASDNRSGSRPSR